MRWKKLLKPSKIYQYLKIFNLSDENQNAFKKKAGKYDCMNNGELGKVFSGERFSFSFTWVHDNNILYEKTIKIFKKNVNIVLIDCKKHHNKLGITAVCVAHKS